MKKKLLGFGIITILCTIIILTVSGSHTSRAVSFASFDARTAVSGASLALKKYLAAYPDGAQILKSKLDPIKENADQYRESNGENAPGEDVETLYEKRIIGVVTVESSLNVRASSTMLSEVVGQEYRGMELYVLGERITSSTLWYKVLVRGSIEGYVMGKYIVFDEEADAFKQLVHEEYRDNTPLPEQVKYEEAEVNSLPDSARTAFLNAAKEVNYVLKTEFNNYKDQGSYLGMYTVLIYALENYNKITDICDQYGLTETSKLIRNQVWVVELNRERLSHESDTTYDEFNQQMVEEAERKAREAKEAAEAAERAYKASMAYQIPNYAAQFVNVLPYVWGGASLTYGADCSGFVSQIYAHFGLLDQASANAHAWDSYALRSVGYAVSLENIQPGDLVCYNGHVAIYYGNGVIVHAPSPGKRVSFSNLYLAPVVAVRRLY